MSTYLLVAGTSHKVSPIEIREKLSFVSKGLGPALDFFAAEPGIRGCVILSTCNRVEVYAECLSREAGPALKNLLADYHEVARSKIEPHLYALEGLAAVRHLYAVASGLDSQIIGEIQIAGQVRSACHEAEKCGTLTPLLERLFRTALRVSSHVRSHTGIASGTVSLGSVVLNLIQRHFQTLDHRKILLIGSGKVSELLARHLRKAEAELWVTSRTFERARELAEKLKGRVFAYDHIKTVLPDMDILVSSTACPQVILKKKDFTRRKKPLMAVDLAVPRDIDPKVKSLAQVKLFDLDDLNFIIEENVRRRKASAGLAEELISREAERLWTKPNSAFSKHLTLI